MLIFKIKHILKNIIQLLLICIALIIIIGFSANLIIMLSNRSKLFDDIEKIQHNHAALVLGTSRHLKSGDLNPFFKNRIEAAVKLFENGKINCIIVSGDNRSIYYNEPKQMKQELIKAGIPDSLIFMDSAGLRTLDSVIRAYEVFEQNEFTIISQKFHNQRALFIAQQNNINAIAFNAEDVENSAKTSTFFREFFARIKVFMDIVFNTKPLITEEKINIEFNS